MKKRRRQEKEENKKTRQTYFSVFYLVPNQHSHMTGCACRIRQEAVTHLSERFVGNVVVRDLLPLLLLFYHTNYFQRQLAVVLQWRKIQRKNTTTTRTKSHQTMTFQKCHQTMTFEKHSSRPVFVLCVLLLQSVCKIVKCQQHYDALHFQLPITQTIYGYPVH